MFVIGIKDIYTLSGLTWIFSFKQTVFINILHRLVFDLWVALWIVSDAAVVSNNLPYFMLLTVMVTTLCFGPAGLALYILWKFIIDKMAGNPAKLDTY